MLTIGSLFSGVGGLETGLEQASLGPVLFQVENNAHAQQVLRRHWPDADLHADVRGVGRHNLPRVDVVCGGSPCVGFSRSGAQGGLGDPRSGLWHEFARVVGELGPTYVVFENVAQIQTLHGGRHFARVVDDLAARGYATAWWRDTAAAAGAPHLRERVWLVGWQMGDADVARLARRRLPGPERADRGAARAAGGAGAGRAEGSALTRLGGDALRPAHRLDKDRITNDNNDEAGLSGSFLRNMRPEDVAACLSEREERHDVDVHGAEILRSNLRRDSQQTPAGVEVVKVHGVVPVPEASVRALWNNERSSGSSPRREQHEQRPVEPDDLMRLLSHEMALGEWIHLVQETVTLPRMRSAIARIRTVSDSLHETKTQWHALSQEERRWVVDAALCPQTWPARRGEAQFSFEPPRTTLDGRGRRARLTALGNIALPANARVAGELIVLLEDRRRKGLEPWTTIPA
jgi:DNA-cytosine methyltransferase